MNKWNYLENIATLCAVAFLVWLTGSAWWALLLLNLNYQKKQ